MSKTGKIVIFCLIMAVVVAVIPLLTIKNSEFGGADGKAKEAITAVNKNYKPWFKSIISPPGGETESLLFALQAAAGAGVLGYGIGYLVSRKKFSERGEE